MFETKSGKEHDDELDYERNQNLVLWKVIFLLSIIIVLLGIGYIDLKKNNVTVVKLPSNISATVGAKEIVYGLNRANKPYYEIWGRALVEDISNFNPDNINEKMNDVINLMRPSNAVKKMEETDKFKQDVVVNKITQSFTKTKVITTVSKDASNGNVKISGIQKQKVGETAMKDKECVYEFDFEFLEGVFYVKNFGSNCI